MRYFIILATILAFARGLPTGNSSDANALSPRIIDGGPISKNLYYEVAIVSDVLPIKLCSGVFITSKFILTSAFCANRRPTLRVYYGVNYVQPENYWGSQLVEKVHCYPNYNPLNLDHDIAILELGAAVTDPYITRVSLPSPENYSYKGLTATVSGWGPSPGGVSNNQWFRLESKQTIVTDNLFCTREGIAMSPYKLCTEDRAVCEGDQGAPLIIDNRVIGIATAAHNALNCQGQIVTPYTRVNTYLRWINQVTGSGPACTTNC